MKLNVGLQHFPVQNIKLHLILRTGVKLQYLLVGRFKILLINKLKFWVVYLSYSYYFILALPVVAYMHNNL